MPDPAPRSMPDPSAAAAPPRTPEEAAHLARTLDTGAVAAAAKRLIGRVERTPTVMAGRLRDRLGQPVYLKPETLQATGAFKERGACNRLFALPEDDLSGVVAMSAGNHAQAVARMAALSGRKATIVMPTDTPFTKVARTEAFGARVILSGATVDAAAAEAHRLAAEDDLTFIHPYDDPLIIAGQATLFAEMLADRPSIDTVVVPVGGGGLCAGAVLAARAHGGVRVVGVQVSGFAAMAVALGHADAAEVGGTGTLAEGIAVKQPGLLTRHILREAGVAVITVPETAIERAIELLATEAGLIAEGAGAAGLAALLTFPDRFAGRTVGLPICGGNIDQRLLASILMRGLFNAGRLARLRMEIDDRPGGLARVAALIAQAGGNIVEVSHGRLGPGVPVKRTDLDVMVEARDPAGLAAVERTLAEAGIPVTRLSAG